MDKPKQISDAEKIKRFETVYNMAKDELNKTAERPDRPTQYFWESVMEIVLKLNKEDWEKHNNRCLVI